MSGILKRRRKDGTYTCRAQVRLNDGLPPQSKTFPTLPEARAWKSQEETKRRQGMYLPSMTSKEIGRTHRALYHPSASFQT